MTHYMLFCVAEEAKAFVHKVMPTEKGPHNFQYALAESRHGPPAGQPFRDTLREDETIETDFIGASADECGAWMLEQQGKHNTLYHNLMVILDARSAEDETATLWFRPFDLQAPFLRRDQGTDTWYPFRVHHSRINTLAVEFTDTGAPSETYGVLFRRKEELTGDDGLFDLKQALDLIFEGKGFVLEGDQYWDRLQAEGDDPARADE
ncbi:hypothetical protein F5Y14DRAFT_437622 [Nemania sp. NC0429]|nr:hypothetical protein F5Y14DRAFT_437622 [Nemania sp. NC0429]